ncbi:cytochrome c oxidase subunit 3 family protein [Mycobacterium sp. 1274761.0]|uniref:cytochrome c oxidase subunit 3 family protein n=1 Tax=Mycobacterium sp. 1274761.0 TaxID=1834077 RepID=UPI000801F6A6|nr:cytochrome c oxidase subunit 3 family protein [Mycobacterium sp. 1274761.0]OBK70260.1 cytochrome C oxidase subunit III [Mycobacterium sp. 1274761.0]
MTNTEQSAPDIAVPSSIRAAHLPGDIAMWVMVLGDFVFFGAYFVIFMVHRSMAPELYLQSQQHLNLTIGMVNTLVLLTSSWFIARSVQTARSGDQQGALRLTYLGGACGVAFIVIKAFEWSSKIAQGHTMPSNEFFLFYYMLTGVHLFHVGLGLLILGIVVRELRNPRKRRASMVESGATYWHMVDLLWIVIFGLLYVMR